MTARPPGGKWIIVVSGATVTRSLRWDWRIHKNASEKKKSASDTIRRLLAGPLKLESLGLPCPSFTLSHAYFRECGSWGAGEEVVKKRQSRGWEKRFDDHVKIGLLLKVTIGLPAFSVGWKNYMGLLKWSPSCKGTFFPCMNFTRIVETKIKLYLIISCS